MLRPAENESILGMPTPMVNLKIKVKNNQGENLATPRALPDTGASVDCIKEKFTKKHNLTILLDITNMIKLVNTKGKTMKELDTTKITLPAPGGG